MWPDGARCAVSFTFDFDAEEVWIGEDPANAGRPGVLSQGTYGAKVAVPAILEILARRGVRATCFVPGRVAKRHPGRQMGGACVLTMHPQIIGRPGRLAFLDSFIDFVAGHGDVWVATAAEIAARA